MGIITDTAERMDFALRFRQLFFGRTDAYGAVWGESIKRELQDYQWVDHLFREDDQSKLGIYPMVQMPEGFMVRDGVDLGPHYVRWGCTDIDIGFEEGWPLAVRLHQALGMLGINAWIEKTKGKGWHVWVFATDWVPAEVMRRALLAAHKIADVRVVEVNPKQTDTGHLKVGLGNYVNLPYPAGHQATRRRVVVAPRGDDDPLVLHLEDFVPAALLGRADFDTLLAAARLWTPPKPKARVSTQEISMEAKQVAQLLPGLPFTIWRDGPLEGRDRSSTEARLAHLCQEAGLTASQALVILDDADMRWGKFHDRHDRDEQLQRLIDNAYG